VPLFRKMAGRQYRGARLLKLRGFGPDLAVSGDRNAKKGRHNGRPFEKFKNLSGDQLAGGRPSHPVLKRSFTAGLRT